MFDWVMGTTELLLPLPSTTGRQGLATRPDRLLHLHCSCIAQRRPRQ